MSNTKETTKYEPLLAELTDRDGAELCAQLRQDLVESVSKTGGHLASNLGAVELTVAIHRVFDTSRDRLVFDVGHQCYVHKILTGRREEMKTLRQYHGIAGFPKPTESIHDAFIAGHASNSVAVALGMAQARTMQEEDYKVLALIGDGALTGGLAYEGLSNAGECKQQLLVILNDNGMSITPNVGGVADYLAKQRLKPQYLSFKRSYRKVMGATALGRKVYRVTRKMKNALKQSILPCSMFENMGFHYLGPVDGHDLPRLTKILHYAKDLNEPVLLHVKTVKGKGFTPAEERPNAFHGVSPFDPMTGEAKKKGGDNFSAVFGRTLARLGTEDKRVCAITAAMMSGTGLEHFQKACPERFFDVGIAEQHAVGFAAGLAKGGMKPYVCIYSTFLQRAYDQIVHDVCLQDLPVKLLIDRAGIVGEDGETHQGMLDVGYLRTCPGLTLMAPRDGRELSDMLDYSLDYTHPLAIRYPRGSAGSSNESRSPIEYGKAELLRRGAGILFWAAGNMVDTALAAADAIEKKIGRATVVNARFIKPLDEDLLKELSPEHEMIVVLDEGNRSGGLGEAVEDAVSRLQLKACVLDLEPADSFIPQGPPDELRKRLRLDAESIAEAVLERRLSLSAEKIRSKERLRKK